MTGLPSIFLKICPDCAAQVPTASERCKCGHIFESAISSELSPEEAALRDEELYENYLSARAEQAHQAARAAQDALMDDPDSSEKAAQAELTREVAKSIDADLAEQRTKLAALRRTVEAQRPKPTLPAFKPIEVPPASPPVAQPQIEAVSEIVVSTPPISTPSPLKPVKPVASPASSPALASPAAVAQKAARVLNAIKQAKAREATTRTQKPRKAPAKTVAAPKPAPPPTPQPPIEVSTVPPPSFRQEQAARAELVMETRKLADTKDCPNCTANVPVNTTRCSCGFTFIASGNDLPSLTLCTGDFTALRNSLNLNLRRR